MYLFRSGLGSHKHSLNHIPILLHFCSVIFPLRISYSSTVLVLKLHHIPAISYSGTQFCCLSCHTLVLSYPSSIVFKFCHTLVLLYPVLLCLRFAILQLYHTRVLSYPSSIVFKFCHTLVLLYPVLLCLRFAILQLYHTLILSYPSSIVFKFCHIPVISYTSTAISQFYCV